MAETSAIAWTDATFNPWIGCTKISPGCKHCYAEKLATTRLKHRLGEVWGVSAPRYVTSDSTWKAPLTWNRKAAAQGRPMSVFCGSLCDVFEGTPATDGPRQRLWRLIERTPALRWLLLTKRPHHVRRLVPLAWLERWPAHVAVGTSVEGPSFLTERVTALLRVPAPMRFLSCEPLLAPLDFRQGWWCDGCGEAMFDAAPCGWGHGKPRHVDLFEGIGWVIVGGENAARQVARPFQVEWARSVREQCAARGVPFFFKQAGSVPQLDGARLRLPTFDGSNPAEWPEDLRQARAFPWAA